MFYSLIIAGLLSCMAGTSTLLAKDYVAFKFTAEITHLQGGDGDINVNRDVGDQITGLLMYDPRITPVNPGDPIKNFNLAAEAKNKFILFAGDEEFRSPATEEAGLRARLHSSGKYVEDENGNQKFVCRQSMRFATGFNTVLANGEVSEEQSAQMILKFQGDDCAKSFDANRLPKAINLSDWYSSEMIVEALPSASDYFLMKAKITSINLSSSQDARVTGTVYSDYNADCTVNGLDAGLSRQIVKFTPGPYLTATNENGEYNITLPAGDYLAEVVKRPYWSQACPAGPTTVSVLSPGDHAEADFSLEAEELIEAACVSIVSTLARPGFGIEYTIVVHNTGTLPYNGTIRFEHDGVLTSFSSHPVADAYIAPVAEWDIVELPVDGTFVIRVTLRVPPDEKLLGTTICANVSTVDSPKTGDEILSGKEDAICQEIRGAFDPNDIQVFSGTANADGAISPDDKVLTYLIRFQNEGNEDAITVRVVDALSEFHNVEKIELGASSHEFSFDFTNDGEMEWTFNNINLAPKERDEVASQGFLKFKVHLQDELAIGTEIPNSAAIYFDFNSPVITNTVVSRIVNTTTSVRDERFEASVIIYPNPSAENVTINFGEMTSAELTVRNVMGEAVLTQNINAARYNLKLSELSAGSYYLSIVSERGTAVKPINIVR